MCVKSRHYHNWHHNRQHKKVHIARSLRRLSTYLRLKQQPISDYDILVEFSSLNPIPLSRFLQVKENLENVLRSDIDLVTKSGLGNKSFKQRVLNNMEVIYDDQKNIWRLNHMA